MEDFDDIEAINAYHELKEMNVFSEEELMARICYKNRDNARTPMQWDDSANAGFTTGTPWLAMNQNYTKINARDEVADSDSVFHFYQKLIALRKSYEIIVYGKYNLLMPEDRHIFSYTRTYGDERLLVVCNFSEESQKYTLPEGYDLTQAELLLHNMEKDVEYDMAVGYEAMVWYWKNVKAEGSAGKSDDKKI